MQIQFYNQTQNKKGEYEFATCILKTKYIMCTTWSVVEEADMISQRKCEEGAEEIFLKESFTLREVSYWALMKNKYDIAYTWN